MEKIQPGYRRGRLMVSEDTGKRKNGYIIWRCICDCGGNAEVDMRTLRRGSVTDCGCAGGRRRRYKNIAGQRFGRLTAVACAGKHEKNGGYLWRCVCDCGGEVVAPLHQLTGGYRKSCGCLSHPPRKDWQGSRFGRLVVTAYAGKWDGMNRWRCRCDCGQETVVGQSLLQRGKTKSCGCLRAEVYRDNLKLVADTSITLLESRKNKVSRNNKSGHTGVYRDERHACWEAQIGFRGKTYHLGCFSSKEEAVRVRAYAEKIHEECIRWYYGEYLPSLGESGEDMCGREKMPTDRTWDNKLEKF